MIPFGTSREVFEHLLCHGGVRVVLRGHDEGVQLPGHIRELDPLILEYELAAVVPITDLDVTDDGISATLSFSRTPVKTFVPWTAVLGMIGMQARAEQPPARERPKLRLV